MGQSGPVLRCLLSGFKEIEMYQFFAGPMLWLSCAIFALGLIYRVVMYIKGLAWQLDRVTYTYNVGYGIKGAIRSVGYWLLPFGTRSWRTQPLMTVLFFTFHIGLIVTPIFLLAHNVLFERYWGFSLFTLPVGLADALTIMVIISGIFLTLRRLILPEVRFMTGGKDYLVLAIAMAPFISGLLISQQVVPYQTGILVHIITGEIMLVAMPFTKLAHVVLFFCTRVQLGMDFGIKRGGMKGTGMSW
jgi:nitrate reductase gamma subunit